MGCFSKIPHILREMKVGKDNIDYNCLLDGLLALAHESMKSWEPRKQIPYEKELKKYFEKLDKKDKENFLSNVYRMNRKYYDALSKALEYSLDLSKIHR